MKFLSFFNENDQELVVKAGDAAGIKLGDKIRWTHSTEKKKIMVIHKNGS